jgi:LacI family transcriptional regulator
VKRPTQLDVAKKAGVSRATVSLIINDQESSNVRISEETRQRVQAAVAELGYQPNLIAQSLRRQRTNLVALLIPDITNPYYPLLIRGAQNAADQHDYQLLIYDSDDSPAREHSFVDSILRRRVDGVILQSFHLSVEDVSRLVDAGIEVVGLGRILHEAGLEVSVITSDHSSAITALIKHLVEKGHRRIAHIAGPLDTPPGLERMQIFREALSQYGLQYDPNLVKIGTFRGEGIAELVKSLVFDLPDDARPTAIFAANDLMAIETIRSLTSLGYQVPDEIAVCGFDDIPPSAWITPALTTVGQNPYEQGKQAASLLLQHLLSDEKSQVENINVPYQLVVRDST